MVAVVAGVGLRVLPNTVVVHQVVPRRIEGVSGWAAHPNRVMWEVPPNMAAVRQVVLLNMADLLEAEVANPFNPAKVHYDSLSPLAGSLLLSLTPRKNNPFQQRW